MKVLHRKLNALLIVTFLSCLVNAQGGKIDSVKFFADERPFEMTISSDFKGLMGKKSQKAYQPATVSFKFADSSEIADQQIRIQPRGKFRLENCYMPPLYLNFKNETSKKLKTLGKLKLVCGCATSSEDEQLIIKEYMAYKIYNMLTPKSFRVRLVKVNFDDTRGKVKKYSQYGFLLEDVDAMAARNKCYEVEKKVFNTEATDRAQMTMVAIFEYMIGNSDFSVPNYHNVKLMRHLKDSVSTPYVVPYDLNHSGFVNASYAVPPEELGIKSVTERVYRGFPRSMEELDIALAVYKNKKKDIFSLISECTWLNNRHKKEITRFLEDFYETIENKNAVKTAFISNARTN